ncbi:hypothetical protein LINGRAHAP2_LOCUS24295 [Linum grandiflorum]
MPYKLDLRTSWLSRLIIFVLCHIKSPLMWNLHASMHRPKSIIHIVVVFPSVLHSTMINFLNGEKDFKKHISSFLVVARSRHRRGEDGEDDEKRTATMTRRRSRQQNEEDEDENCHC